MNNLTNIIYNEDCQITQSRNLGYSYSIFSPPDFEEIGYSPDDIEKYKSFIINRMNLSPKTGYVTIFISDRKYKGGVVNKNQIILKVMQSCGYKLVSQKIWVKSYLKNLYRHNYTFILTFHNQQTSKMNPILPDVFYQEHKNVGSYSYNFAPEIVKEFISAYTKEGDIVFDPYIGSGSTALACIDLNRGYFGAEIDPEYHKLAEERIHNYQGLWQ